MLFSLEKKHHRGAASRLLCASVFFLMLVGGFTTHVAQAAILTISPISGAYTYSVGQLFSVGVYVGTTPAQPLNVVSGILSFDPSLLQLISVEKTGSIIDFWISGSSFSNTNGQANFEGGTYNPGFSGSSGKVISFLFRAKAPGVASFSLSSASVLANDGSGTGILERTGTTGVTIVPAVAPVPVKKPPVSGVPAIVIHSQSHPDQDIWYTTNTVYFDWDVPTGATSVRTSLTQGATDVPTEVATPPITNSTETVDDGIWYFHLQGRDATRWGPATHYRVQIDTAPRTPPILGDFRRTILEGESVRISGSTYSNSTVHIYLKDSKGNEFTQETRSGAEGIFDTVWNKRLDKGGYTVSASVTDARNISSPRSSEVPITIQAHVLERIGWPLLNFATLFLIFALVIALCIAWALYLTHRIRKYRRKVRSDVHRADTRIRAKFKRLEAYITEYIEILKQEGAKRPLTFQEEKLIANIWKVLQNADAEIESDVEKIGK
jgi:hypothetical protein